MVRVRSGLGGGGRPCPPFGTLNPDVTREAPLLFRDEGGQRRPPPRDPARWMRPLPPKIRTAELNSGGVRTAFATHGISFPSEQRTPLCCPTDCVRVLHRRNDVRCPCARARRSARGEMGA